MKRRTLSIDDRERVAFVFVVLMFLLLLVGLFRLQVLEHSELAAQSENNRIRVVPVEARRGRVYDRYGRIIVDNRPSYTVSVVSAEEVSGLTLPNLSELIGVDTAEIRRRVRKNTINRYQPAPVMRDVPFEVVAVLEEQYESYPGVSYEMERVRQYASGLGTECFTGHVGEVSEQELKGGKSSELRLGSTVGKKGLERQSDLELRGIEGTRFMEVFATGQIQGVYEDQPGTEAIPGADLTLTIDLDVQRAATEALDTFCCGAIVAIDPRDGGVLAMTSYPSYDANIFSSVIPEELWNEISSDSTHPLLNRPLVGQYPPGSTIKPLVIGAGLEEGIINKNSTYQPCTGGYRFGNRVFRCWQPAGHGALTAVHVIEQSCDVFMYQLGLNLGLDVLADYYGRCGFGRLTGIDLPGEVAGLNPDRTYYNSRYGENKWTRGLVLNLSIGQGELLATPLQIAQFYCGLANNGAVYRPHILKQMKFADGQKTETAPELSFRLPFSPATLDLLKEGLRLVVEGEHGTAKSIRNDRYTIGGKTGTAQNPHGEDHSLFVGFAPLENPQIVVCAIVENAGHGSEVAAPVVAKVIESYMSKVLGPADGALAEEDKQ